MGSGVSGRTGVLVSNLVVYVVLRVGFWLGLHFLLDGICHS